MEVKIQAARGHPPEQADEGISGQSRHSSGCRNVKKKKAIPNEIADRTWCSRCNSVCARTLRALFLKLFLKLLKLFKKRLKANAKQLEIAKGLHQNLLSLDGRKRVENCGERSRPNLNVLNFVPKSLYPVVLVTSGISVGFLVLWHR